MQNFFDDLETISILNTVESANVLDRVVPQLINNMLHLLLMTPAGIQMRWQALQNQHTLLEEVEKQVMFSQSDFPIARISELARDSQRTPVQMLDYLTLLGLKVYEQHYLPCLDKTIEEESALLAAYDEDSSVRSRRGCQ